MYTRAKTDFRPFSIIISNLRCGAALQSVGNHQYLRNPEEGGSVKPVDNRSLFKLHNEIFV
jgi:hypothetical protein